jgi:hypothetical protein
VKHIYVILVNCVSRAILKTWECGKVNAVELLEGSSEGWQCYQIGHATKSTRLTGTKWSLSYSGNASAV